MLRPVGLTHGHYECRSLDQTLPVFTDLLAMRVVERAEKQAVVEHPNTAWRLVVHEGGAAAPDKPHNNHYGVRVAHEAEIDAAHAYLEANKARYGLTRVSPPRSQHFARSVYFEEPGGNTLEIEYYAPQAAAEGRKIARPHWDRELAARDFPGRGYVPQALTHGTLECDDK
ncbi:MAG TPA: VOC family protein, partial [Burkholderiales bacterium]|nr:VOC family protein [Burkholderiales bacterium]